METLIRRLAGFATGVLDREPVARWQTLALLWIAGGAIAVVSGLLDGARTMTAAGSLGIGTGIALAGAARQLDPRLIGPMLVVGSSTATLATVTGGPAAATMLFVLVWAGVTGWYFLSLRGALAYTVLAVGLGGLTVAALPAAPSTAVALWAGASMTLVVVGGLAAALRLRGDRALDRLRAAADRDEVTSALNRHGFSVRAAIALARHRRTGEPVAMVLADLGGAGEDLLRGFVACCDAELRATDAVARIGDARFALLLCDADALSGTAVTERIRRRVSTELAPPVGAPPAAAFGIADVPTNALDLDGLLDAADLALRTALLDGHDPVARAAVRPAGR